MNYLALVNIAVIASLIKYVLVFVYSESSTASTLVS